MHPTVPIWLCRQYVIVRPTHHRYLLASSKAAFYQLHSNTVPPMNATTFALPPTLPKMLYLWITPYLEETAAWAYKEQGRLQFMVHSSDIPSNFPLQLNTSAFKLIVPKLFIQYPNKGMSMVLNASGNIPFFARVHADGLNVTATFQTIFYV